MSKKDDLKLVFDFIAEYLKDEKEQPKGVKMKELLVENKEVSLKPKNDVDDILLKMKAPIDNVGADAAYIKQLMDRVEAKTIEQATTNFLLTAQRKEFEQELKKLKDKASEELITQKVADETVNDLITTEDSVVGNDIDSTVVNDLTTEKILGKR